MNQTISLTTRQVTAKGSHLILGAFYARVSSDQQAQDQTIDSQVAALRDRIAADGVMTAENLRFIDDGVSGSTLARPALERLRDAAYGGAFQKLYVHSPDRLATDPGRGTRTPASCDGVP